MENQHRMPRRSILFLVHALHRSGAETQLVDLANGLPAQKYDKSLLVFSGDNPRLERLDQDGTRFHLALRRGKYNPGFIWRIATFIDENQVDIVHCTMEFSLLIACLALKLSRRKPKLVVALHQIVPESRKAHLLERYLYRRLLGSCSKIVFVCHAQAAHWQRKYPEIGERSVVVYNGVDPQKYQVGQFVQAGRCLREGLGIPADDFIIACVSNLRPLKGHEYLIKAFRTLPACCHLILAGRGQMFDEVQALVAAEGLSGRVHLIGSVEDVRPLLEVAEISVIASWAETFSIAMLESMAMQTPVVATDVGGLGEACRPGISGELVPAKDAEALGDCLASMFARRQLLAAMGVTARQLILREFSVARMVSATDEVLESALNSNYNNLTRPSVHQTSSHVTGQPLCSVIIVNWKSVSFLEHCLSSLQSNCRYRYEVIVIDNDSGRQEQERLASLTRIDQLILNSTNRRFAAANNQGIRAARGEYILLLNPDTLVIDDAIDQLIRFLSDNPRIFAVAPRLYSSPDRSPHPSVYKFPTPFGQFLGYLPLSGFPSRIRQRLSGSEDRARRVDWVMGCAVLLRKSVFKELGGLDEDYYFYQEEVDLFRRMSDAHMPLYFFPAAEIVHFGGVSQEQADFHKEEMLIRSRFLYFRKYFPAWSVRINMRLLATLIKAKLALSTNPILALRLREIERELEGMPGRKG